MIFVLLMMVVGGGGLSAEFDSQAACENAIAKVAETDVPDNGWGFAICVPKSGE